MIKDQFIQEQYVNGNIQDLYNGIRLKPTYELEIPQGKEPKKFRDKITQKLRYLGYQYNSTFDIYIKSKA